MVAAHGGAKPLGRPAGVALSDLGGQRKEFPHPPVDHLAASRHQGLAGDFVIRVETKLAIPEQVNEKRRDVAREPSKWPKRVRMDA